MSQPTPKKDAKELLTISGEHRLRMENLPFDIDVWFPAIKQFTFRSAFIPLVHEEAIAIMNYQNTRFNGRPRLTTYDVKVLQDLEYRIDCTVKKEFGTKGAFMRLCGRSPKDGEPLDRKKVADSYQAALEQLILEGLPNDANTKLLAVSKVHWLTTRNGEGRKYEPNTEYLRGYEFVAEQREGFC